ncbi:putative NRPS-like protein biosynthetic cluster [Marasmius oreades]|uniref:NRPS-like protein biosynthetic cluster n=1 Tax=Marasmius oreades TaxID=181124 RepID=A0A9P7ULS6_9AGAR|nr:putative NRPS-like protein biosynthetic cluster [Marasmius oreades]KAG7086748.1 putative NRPS-like protein biosynthetic cluster [Marasmius oreades]
MNFIRPHLNLGYEPDLPHGVNGLPELIAFNAQHNQHLVFCRQIRAGEGYHEITFAQLQAAVERCSAWLVASGVTEGPAAPSPVGIFLGSDVSIFIYIAALLRIGTPVLLLSARLSSLAVAHLLRSTSTSSLLYSPQVSRTVQSIEGLDTYFRLAPGYESFLSDDLTTIPIPPPYLHTVRHQLGAVIMHSSGTTGLPKPIYHAPAYLLGYAACHNLSQPSSPFGYNVSTLPLYHGFGLLAPCLSLSIGLPFVLPPASIIPTALTTLASLRLHNAYSMLSVPSVLEDILTSSDLDAITTLKSLNFIAIGGAPMKEFVAEQLVSKGVKLLNHWGATEIGAIALIQHPPPNYDWHYLIPRTDLNLEIVPIDPSSCRLIGHPPGWSQPFHVQDLLIRNPSAHNQLRILGRADDLIVLCTGEKVRPTSLERAVAEHPQVKDVLAFGSGRPGLGLLVELLDGTTNPNDNSFMQSFIPYLERGNSLTDGHGKVASKMVIFTTAAQKPLIRTDKGSLARKENFVAFQEEIEDCYEAAEQLEVDPLPTAAAVGDGGGGDLQDSIRQLVVRVCATTSAVDFSDPVNDSLDFFEMGMDSLQATRLRRMIQSALPGTSSVLPPDFCFRHSSVAKLCNAIVNIDSVQDSSEEARVEEMHAMVDKCIRELRTFEALATVTRNQCCEGRGKFVLLTGSTGSLGCLLLEKLSADPTVRKLFCLNRPRRGGSRAHQIYALKKRGVIIRPEHWEKVIFLQGRTGADKFGLSDTNYSQLLEVTHIIHNAWPVDFNRTLSSFEPHIRTILNLVKLCLQSTTLGTLNPKRILFASSIAVVGNYPLLVEPGAVDIPETALDARATDGFGYPEAKWVCEKVLEGANEMYGSVVRTSSVRIGQMTGPEGSGAWNETEHFPMMCRSSQVVGALPVIDGSLSWMPVNRAAVVICELLFCQRFQPFYHLENPSRQSWEGIIEHLSKALIPSDNNGDPSTSTGTLPVIPFPEWVERVRSFGGDPTQNAALKIMDFIQRDFVRMAGGSVILNTNGARKDSPTMVRSTAVERRHVEEYCGYWRSVGVLK